MTADRRQSRWSSAVAEQTGSRSSLSLQLFTDEEPGSLGALNRYSPKPNAFDAETRGVGMAFAAQAAADLCGAAAGRGRRDSRTAAALNLGVDPAATALDRRISAARSPAAPPP